MWGKIVAVTAVTCCLFSENVRADGFFTLPILEEASIRHGWYYVKTARYEQRHYATDYRTVDGQEIIAACDGVAIAAESWADSGVGAYGHFTLERCDDLAPDGSRYMVIYAHLERQADSIASKSRYDTDYSGWTTVRRGDLVGYAGQSGTTWPHVHFEVFTGDYAHKLNHRVDPYNLYGLAAIYPGDGIGTGTTGYLWFNFPPESPDSDSDGDTFTTEEGDCNDTNPDIHPGAEERCDNLDNNCADGVDEEPATSASCRDSVDCTIDVCLSDTHVCSHFVDHDACEDGDPCTTNLCLLWVGCRAIPRDEDLDTYTDSSCGGDDCDDGDFHIHPEAPERCNYLDDDCDGEIDEDWRTGLSVDLGEPCGGERGECYRTGIWDCEPLHRGTVCTAEIVSGTPETCDDLDNDCDGETDEDWLELGFVCGTPPCEGTYICSSDGLTSYCDIARDRDGDTHPDDLCGGDDCNDSNSSVWTHTVTEARLARRSGYIPSVSAVWTGTELGVVWVDVADGYYDIFFTRADVSLTEIGDDVRVTAETGNSNEPSLVWNSREYGLVWVDDRSSWSSDIYFVRLDATGLKIGGDTMVVGGDVVGSTSFSPSLVWTGSEFGIVFLDDRFRGGGTSRSGDLFFIRLNSDGAVIGPETLIPSGGIFSRYHSLVWTGTEYGLAFGNVISDTQQGIYFTRLGSSGSIVGSTTLVEASAYEAGVMVATPDLVWQGSEFAIAWVAGLSISDREIYFGRVDAVGVMTSPEVQITDNPLYSDWPVLAWNGRNYGLIWRESHGSPGSDRFIHLGSDGRRLGSEVFIGNCTVARASIFWTGHEYLLVWADCRDTGSGVYLGRVSCGW